MGRLEWERKNWANSRGLLEFPWLQKTVSVGNPGEKRPSEGRGVEAGETLTSLRA